MHDRKKIVIHTFLSFFNYSTKQEMTYEVAVAVRFLDIFQSISHQEVPSRGSQLPDVIFNNCENWLNNL